MKNRQLKRHLWPYFVSFLLLAVVSSFLFGGYHTYVLYKRSVDPDLGLTTSTYHFFVREFILRQYAQFTVDPLPKETSIPSIHIFADEQDLDSLNSDLPASGKTQFFTGHIRVDKPEFSSEINFRYRGGIALHWLYKKKSLRVKLPPYTTFLGERQFNLVNPSTVATITDWLSYDMSRSVGLLTPDYFPARVFFNRANNGLHFFLSRIDESFLRKNKRMPGSIYEGETIDFPTPFGLNNIGSSTVVLDDQGLPRLWRDERLWEKRAARSLESKTDRRDIQKFIEIVNEGSAADFMRSFEIYFDKEKFYKFWALDSLVGTYHHDLFHNHKIYFDPYKGKFEPIEWDIRFWTSVNGVKDLVSTPLLQRVILNPVLEHERDVEIFNLLQQFPVDDVIDNIQQADNLLRVELAADPFRHAPDNGYPSIGDDKEMPFTMPEYDEAIDQLKLIYNHRHLNLNKVLNNSRAIYSLKAGDNTGEIVLTVSVNGNSAIEFNPYQLLPEVLRADIEVYRSYQNQLFRVKQSNSEILYPGRFFVPGNFLGRTDKRAILGFGKEKASWSPLNYQYLIRGLDKSNLPQTDELLAANAVTGERIILPLVNEVPADSNTQSTHPWTLLQKSVSEDSGEVTLSGEVKITEDTVYSKEKSITIMPGTVFRLAKDKSLLFYGKVKALGTQLSPIQFTRLDAGDAWGSIVVQGVSAAGSVFRHVRVAGGSLSRHRLINYTGQFNIHDLPSFTLSDCVMESNQVGDDALHIAYSKGEIDNCRFDNTAFDALDIDISSVSITNTEFVGSGNDGIDLMTSTISIENVSINGAGDKCISVGEESSVSVKNSKLSQCETGIAVKDNSQAYLENVVFNEFGDIAISLYQKNSRYGKGGTIDGRQLYGITAKDIRFDQGSKILLSDSAFVLAPTSN